MEEGAAAGIAERYQVLEPLGEGAFGRVLKVRARDGSGEFALKIVEVEGSGARLEREIAASLRVSHPHVIRCLEGELRDGKAYLVMEIAEGSLEEVLPDPSRRDEGWSLLRQAGRGVAALHGSGLVHRDLKPANVLIKDGMAKVADLGMVRGTDLKTLTATGTIMGTPLYMPPEQARGERVGPAGDVFSLGVLFFELLEGRPPYPDVGTGELLSRVARGELDDFTRARGRVKREVLDRIRQALSPEPENRPADLDAWLDSLGQSPAAPATPADAAGTMMIGQDDTARMEETGRIGARTSGDTSSLGKQEVTAPLEPAPGEEGGSRLWTAMVLAVVLVGVGFGVSGGGGGDVAAPSPTVSARSVGPFTETYFDRVDREMEELGKKFPDGLDPTRWGRTVTEETEAIRFLRDWVWDDGHRPEELTQEVLDEFVRVNRAAVHRDFGKPFFPFISGEAGDYSLTPTRPPEVTSQELAKFERAPTPYVVSPTDNPYHVYLPPPKGHWYPRILRLSIDLLADYQRWVDDIDDQYRRFPREEAPAILDIYPMLPESAAVPYRVGMSKLPENAYEYGKFVQSAYQHPPPARSLVAGITRHLHERVYANYYLAARAIREDPGNAELIAALVLDNDASLQLFFLGPYAHLPVDWILGPRGSTGLAGDFLHGMLRQRQLRCEEKVNPAAVLTEPYLASRKILQGVLERGRDSEPLSPLWTMTHNLLETQDFKCGFERGYLASYRESGCFQELLARFDRYRDLILRLRRFEGNEMGAIRVATATYLQNEALAKLEKAGKDPPPGIVTRWLDAETMDWIRETVSRRPEMIPRVFQEPRKDITRADGERPTPPTLEELLRRTERWVKR